MKMKYVILILLFWSGFLLMSCDKEDENISNNNDGVLVENNWRLYYERKIGTSLQICSFDGNTEKVLVNDDTYDYWWVKVNPSKTKFLCYRSPKGAGVNSYSQAELMIFDMDGTNGTVILPQGIYGWEIQAHAKWSSDGSKILAIAKCTDPSINDHISRGRIVVFDADGTNPHIISKLKQEIADPAWSPTSDEVVYVACSDTTDLLNADKYELYKATLNQSTMVLENIVRLTYDDKYCFDPNWSPDGQWIAYSKGKFGELLFSINQDIYKCKSDASQDVLVLADGKSNGVPYWSPDNSRLFFHVSGLGENPFGIYFCDSEGLNKTMLLSEQGKERSHISIKNN